ncbi:MAG: molybdopterin cofactor-binding domain-containing protein [Chloroflexota bacterium]
MSQTDTKTKPDQDGVQSATKRRWRPTRRGFLIGAGAVGALIAIGVPVGIPIGRRAMFDMIEESTGLGSYEATPAAWFEVLADSRIRLYLTKVEMGQGVHTSLAQIGIEELGIGWEDLDVVQASTLQGPADANGTGGSWSVSTLYNPLREAAATLRLMLANAAAADMGVSPDEIEIEARALVLRSDPSQSIPLADIAAKVDLWDVPDDLALNLKPQSEFEFIGQSFPRNDILAKVTGEAIYGYDMRLEGMLYGAIARPPTLEAIMKAAWPMNAREMPGVVEIVIDVDANFAGVVAESRAQAYAAVEAMRIDWDEGHLWQQSELEEMVTVPGRGGVNIQKVGNAPRYLRNDATLTAEYRSPFAVHCTLEPQSALADVKADSARFWVSDQSQTRTQGLLAEMLGMKPEQVEVIPTYLGGGFGRRLGVEVAAEAARLSHAAGRPVHVGWNRTEDMRYGYFRPPTHSRLSAKLDDNGQIEAWSHHQASGQVAKPFLPAILGMAFGADFGSVRGMRTRYEFPNIETIGHDLDLPVRTGWWRGLGLMANTFANESFMDELAHMAGRDPLEFRLAHMPDSEWGRRMTAALEVVAEKSGWGTALPEGRARGIACSTDVDTVVAQVAEISLDRESGQIQVHKVTCTNDCGLTINPDGATAQIEGGIMWGVGSTLIEQMQIKNGQVDILNFDAYPLLTTLGAPDIETILLEAGDGIPRGMGEPPIGPPAAAIGNAFFALTGVRLRELPMTPERVLAAL